MLEEQAEEVACLKKQIAYRLTLGGPDACLLRCSVRAPDYSLWRGRRSIETVRRCSVSEKHV
jgi:hypothetical protein